MRAHYKAQKMLRNYFIEKREDDNSAMEWVTNKDIWSPSECLRRGRNSMVSAEFKNSKQARHWAAVLNRRAAEMERKLKENPNYRPRRGRAVKPKPKPVWCEDLSLYEKTDRAILEVLAKGRARKCDFYHEFYKRGFDTTSAALTVHLTKLCQKRKIRVVEYGRTYMGGDDSLYELTKGGK